MRFHRWYTPWLLVLPATVWVVAFNLWPAVNTVILSFTNAKPISGGHFVGLQNYRLLVSDDQLGSALLNTILIMVVCVPLLTVVPLLLALLVEKRLAGITFFRTVFYSPVIASAVVVGLIWEWMLDERGLVNGLAQRLHVLQAPLPFLTDRWLLIVSAISLIVWKGLGYYMVIYLAALANVSRDLHEAAAIDGASAYRRLLHVTLPGVRTTMSLVTVLIAVSALRVFSELYILAGRTGGVGGQDMSVVMLIQQYARGFNGNLGYASTLSLLLFLLTLGPLLCLGWLNRRSAQ